MADEYNEDYYNLLKQQDYEGLLNKEVQIDNARRRALKQTNAGLSAMGMQSSGYGQTATSGIESQYLQALEGANQTYQDNLRNLNIQQMQAQNAERDSDYQQFLTLMQDPMTVSDQEGLDKLLGNYGLITDGSFNYDKAVELYGEKNAMQLRYLYENQVSGYNQESSRQEFNYTSKGSMGYYDEQGNYHVIQLETGMENGWNKENRALESAIKTGSLDNKSYIVMKNKKGMSIYLYYENGKLYRATPAEYNSATGSKYSISYSNITKVN